MRYAIEIRCTRGQVSYLKSLDDSKGKKISFFRTTSQYVSDGVPSEALKVDRDRANYLSVKMNSCRLFTKVVEVSE